MVPQRGHHLIPFVEMGCVKDACGVAPFMDFIKVHYIGKDQVRRRHMGKWRLEWNPMATASRRLTCL